MITGIGTPSSQRSSPRPICRLLENLYGFKTKKGMFGSAVSLPTKTRPIGLLREFRGHLVKPGDETVTLFADGRAVEIPVF